MKRLATFTLLLVTHASCAGTLLHPIHDISREGRRLDSATPNRASLLRTEWGTWRLRSVEVWWACPSRYQRCSDGALQMTQMDNTLLAVRKDLRVAESRLTERRVKPLRDAVAAADAARAKVPVGPQSGEPYWGDGLADYTQAVVDAERQATKLYGRLYGWGGVASTVGSGGGR